jgi:hypothetical protein
VTSPRSRACAAHLYPLFLTFVLVTLAVPKSALAEKVLAKGDDWEVYTDGRVGGFLSWVYGQGFPQWTYEATPDPNDPTITTCTAVRDVMGGGFGAIPEQGPPVGCQPDRGTINSMRIRSGFIGNTLGVGARAKLTEWTTVSGYIQLWAYIESEGRQKNVRNYIDVRQGFAKLEGPWGSFLAGRTRALFSRGATDINSMYAHKWGLGWPGGSNIDNFGPTLGMIGFGVMGSGFAAGMIYGTPVFHGLQLNVGVFDPIAMYGNGSLTRTKYVRPEAELTFERKFGESGKIVLFGNGVYQKVYKAGYCTAPSDPHSLGCDDTAAGVGYGGRFELGPFHLGAAGHYGKGLGTNYALESTDASTDKSGNLRMVDGYYVQGQVVLGKVDVFGGWGVDRIFLTDYDKEPPPAGDMAHSILKQQMGVNAGIVYNVRPHLHLDLDFFRAQAAWFYGESQVVYASNAGLTFNW